MEADIYCLMVTKIWLGPAVRSTLFRVAAEMIRGGESERRIKGDNFEGKVVTDSSRACLGAVSGIKFFAVIESDCGSGTVDYLVRSIDIDGMLNTPDQDLLWLMGGVKEDVEFKPVEKIWN